MPNAIAFSNNDVITIAWSYDRRPEGCIGFAVYQVRLDGEKFVLPNKAVFESTVLSGDGDAALLRPSDKFPIQKFYWKDVYARGIWERSGNNVFHYEIVPMKGTPGNIGRMEELDVLVSNQVEIGPDVGGNMKAYFNRGLISTQRVANYLKKHKETRSLREVCAGGQGENELRDSLSGGLLEALTGFLKRADEKGRIYAGLYELGDEELIEKLEKLGPKLSIVLSNSRKMVDDESRPKYTNDKGKEVYYQVAADDNDDARARLKVSGAELFNRIMPENHIGHNKFLVYVDENGAAKAVLFGSTNWTSTGLCTQTNNTIVVDQGELAERYMDYLHQMVADTVSAAGDPKKLQGGDFRKWNFDPGRLEIGGAAVESWFSPNTPKAREEIL